MWRWGRAGERELLVEGLAPPVTGVSWHEGRLYVSEGGAGRIVRIDTTGPARSWRKACPGNYHTNMAVVGPDG